MKLPDKRLIIYPTLIVLILTGLFFSWTAYKSDLDLVQRLENEKIVLEQNIIVIDDYQKLNSLILELTAKYPGIDLAAEMQNLQKIKELFLNGDYSSAILLIREVSSSLDSKSQVEQQKVDTEARKGDIEGKITSSGKVLADVSVLINQNGQQLAEIKSNADGLYTYRADAGKYTLNVNLAGYNNYSAEIEIKAQEKLNHEIVLQKIVTAVSKPAPSTPKTTTTVVEETSPYYSYQKTTVSSANGNFTVHLMKFDLSSGAVEMIVDTAADGDCKTDCPVKSLKDYVTQNGGFAAINGTYFCPASYGASCANESNGFYYKLYSTRLDQKINWSNGLGDYLPFLMIDTSGKARYFDSWSNAKNLEMKSGLSCRPRLVSGGEIVLTDGDLDSDKERTTKSTRGFIGMKGQTIYAGIIFSANMFDNAAITKALGLDYAHNIDGGGTSAMYYNGAYKVGPGRSMPNAIIFKKK